MLSIYINDEKVLEHNNDSREPGLLRRFLDNMDLDMDEGIEINDETIFSPDQSQRANYVAMNLLHGLELKNEGLISATCSYLVNRFPKLKQIRAIENGKEITMDLIFNEVN